MSTLLIHNIGEIATPTGERPRSGTEQGRILRLPDSEVLVHDGRIVFVGSSAEREHEHGDLGDVERLDAGGGTLVPGWVDPHTHLPWAGSREHEFAARLEGATYQQIAAEGGGILATVRQTREASAEELAAAMQPRLKQMLRWGTTTAEAKSGYGLNLDDEIKQLEAIRRAADNQSVDLVPTLMAAHEVPPEFADGDSGRRADDYVAMVVDEIIPRVAEERLATFCDVFCEQGVFTTEQSRRVLEAGQRYGLTPRLHADEFVDSGGARVAAEVGAASADHLIAVSDEGIELLAETGITAVLLPGTSFFLMGHNYAPARRLIEAGVPVALATDCNPGSSNTESIPGVITLAVLEMGLTTEEALTAATLNAACTLGLGDEIGSVEVGKRADLLVLEAPNLSHLAYHFGINPVGTVVKAGRVVHRQS